jgi:hypothetical protein
MLRQEKRSGADTLLELYGAIDEDLKALYPQLHAKQLARDPRGSTATLSAAEVLTLVVWGAWRGLTDQAKVYFHVQTYPRVEFPTLGAYRKCVEATNRYSVELRALLALRLHRNRQVQGPISDRAARLDGAGRLSYSPGAPASHLSGVGPQIEEWHGLVVWLQVAPTV